MLFKSHQSSVFKRVFLGILVAAYLCSIGLPQSVFAMSAQESNSQDSSWPVYFDIELDEARGWIYGTDYSGNKIDVISTSALTLVKSITLVNGAHPKGIALSPDGSELAIAQGGTASILFLNPDTGQTIASVITSTGIAPYDVIYGRPGRLYSSGSGYYDYIHVIDTLSHTEVSRSPNGAELADPHLEISSDKTWLYASRSSGSPKKLYRFDVSADTIPAPASTAHTSGFSATTYILDPVENLIFTDSGQVWNSNLKGNVGSTNISGKLAYIPSHNAIAVASSNNNGIVFVSTQNFYPLSTYPVSGQLGAVVAQSDGGKLFVSTSNGMIPIDLAAFPPGTPSTLPTGSLPYADLILDETRGLLYGSNSTGHKIDIISTSTLQVINQIRFNNGARPQGMDLSPDGNELAVALNGASSLAFIDINTGEISATVIPNLLNDLSRPFDVIYGRPERLYSSGSPNGTDYLHVLDTSTHTEVGISSFPNTISSAPYLAISADNNSVYTNESSNTLRLFNVSTDSPTIIRGPQGSVYRGTASLLLADNSKIFTNAGQVWLSDLTAQLGSFSATGNLVEIPGRNLIAVASSTSPGLVTFVKTGDFSTASTASMSSVSAVGASVASSDGNKLFVNTNSGIKVLNISLGNPSSISLVSGSPQTVQASTQFQQPFRVKVQNVVGDPMAGVVVTFTAPPTAASGTFADTNSNETTALTDEYGIATSSLFTANNVAGNYTVKATILNITADFQLTNLAAVTCTIGNGPGPASLFLPYKQYNCGRAGHGVAVGDFNNDGRKDVALSGWGALLVFLQDSNGNLMQPHAYAGDPTYLAAADLNGDGLDDIVSIDYYNTIGVYLQRNDGTLAYRVSYPTGSTPDSMAVGDVNSDGRKDVVVSHWNSATIAVFIQGAGGTLNPMISYPSVTAGRDDIAIGDVNGDGRNDVVKMNGQGSYSNLMVYLQNNSNTLDSYIPYSLSGCTSFCIGKGIGIGDVTNDGRQDVVMSYGGNSTYAKLAVFPQDVNGNLQTSVSYSAYDIPSPVEIADLNSDNLLDIALLHSGWGRAGTYLQQPAGSLGSESLYVLPDINSSYNAGDLSIGDVNNDGLPDLLIAGYSGLVVLYRNTTIPPTPTPVYTPTATPPYSYNPLYLSLTGNQAIGGVTSADEDILRFDGTNWSLFFDGSDVGVGGSDLFGFSIVDADTILMAFNTSFTLNGMSVTPRDVLQFDATSLGTNTAGTFSMYFNGIDVGLDVAAENIDSVGLLPDGRVLLSTTGNPVVAGVTGGRDEDVLAFTPTSLGNNTSGSWSLYFDGSDVGLGETSSEDVDALDVTSNGNIYLSTTGDFAATGIVGADEDVFVCVPASLGNTTSCNYLPALYFDGSTWNLTTNDADAINLFTGSPIPTVTPTATQTPGGSTVTPTRTPTITPTFTRTPTLTATSTSGSQLLPDLTITSMRIELQNTSCLAPGDPMGVRVWVTNNGQAAAGSFVVSVNGATQTVNGLAIGEMKAVFFSGYSNPVNTVVDSTNLVTESNESNNARSETLPVPTPPLPCPTITPSPTFTPTIIPTFTNTPGGSDLIFADGFESGTLSAWTSSAINGGDLSVSSLAALNGNQGLQALVNDNSTMSVTDESPNAEPRYRVRFYFDPNSITMASGDSHFIFKAFMGTSTEVIRLEFRQSAGIYQIRHGAFQNDSSWVYNNWITISDAPHSIELDWIAPTTSGPSTGMLTLWIDGGNYFMLAGVDNSGKRIDSVRLGALTGIDNGTRGIYFFDAFESRRQNYIGP